VTQAAEHFKVGRSYTRARRYPWVIGKIQGWTIPLGPYTGTQLGMLIGGVFLLVNTYALWSPLGPLALPILAAPVAATWVVRHAKIEGRAPLRALAGYATLLAEPACGRIGARPASDLRSHRLTGTVCLSTLPGPAATGHEIRTGHMDAGAVSRTPSPAREATAPASASASRTRRGRQTGGRPSGQPARRARGSSKTAAPLASTAAPARPRPQGQHPARQTSATPAARPAPTALQALLAQHPATPAGTGNET
jgi:hypothetical protein